MAKNATIGLNLDITAFRKSLSSAIAGAKSLAGIKPSVKVGVDTSEIDDAEDKIDGLSSTQTVKIDIDTKGGEKSAGAFAGKVSKLGAIAGGALGGAAAQGIATVGNKLFEGAQAADEFADKLEVAFTQQGIADVEGEIEKVRKSTLNLANDLGLPVERTRELAGSVATLGGFTGQSADDLTKLSAGIEVFTDGAVKGEAVAKAFAKGVNDPEGQAAIDALSKKYPQLAETLRSNLSPTEKLAKANEVLGASFETVKDQQGDVGGILNKLQNQLGDVFEDIGSQLLEAVIPIAQSLLPVISSLLPVLQGILTPLTPILEKIGGLVVDLVKNFTGPLLNIVDAVFTPLLGVISSLIEPIKTLITAAMGPLVQVINSVVGIANVLIPVLSRALLPLLPVLGELFTRLLPPIANIVTILANLISKIVSSRAFMLLLNAAVGLLAGAIRLILPLIEFFVGALELVVDIAAQVITYITNLVSAIASFDLNAIKNALLGLDEPAKAASKSTKSLSKNIKDLTGDTKSLTDANKDATNNPPPKPDPEAIKQYAEALKAARAALKDLNSEQAKQRELLAANSLAEEEDRQRAVIDIERRYAEQAIEAQRRALKSSGELREAEESIINKKLEILREDAANKLRDIEAKVQAERVKSADEAEKKITEITIRIAEDRVSRLRALLEAGGVGVANELLAAQRSVIDAQLSQSVDAIAEATPGFKRYAAIIGNDLANGLINADEARKRTAVLRQEIVAGLLELDPADGNVFALQVREAYDKAAREIGAGTQEIANTISNTLGKSGTTLFLENINSVRDALLRADFTTAFNEAREATAGLNEEQERLIQSVKDGEETYQSAAAKFAEIDAKRKEEASATAAVFGEAFRSIAQSQLEAAKESIGAIDELRKRNEEIAQELIDIERRKNEALASLRAQNFENEQLYLASKKSIEDAANAEEKKLLAEKTKNTQKAAAKQEQALLQIGTAAGTAFAGLLTGAQDSGEALKSIVGDTVRSLLTLYAPSIVALFSSVIPPPFGQIAGFAAVAALQALLSSALSGFSEGGYTGNVGTSDVAGVVHGREFVINARDTAKNRALLEHINRGGSVDAFGAAPVTELQMMRAELQAIRQRLDTMPNGINGKQAVALDVGFDTYLYERDRRRAAVRSIRG